MKKQYFYIPVIVIISFLLGGTIIAQGAPAPDEPGKRGVTRLLKLTDEQQSQFDDIHYEHEKKVLELKNRIEMNRLELKRILREDSFDEAEFVSLTDKNTELQSEIKKSFTAMWLNVYKILDENQKEMWKNHLERLGKYKKFARFGHHRGWGAGEAPFMEKGFKRNFRR